MFEYTQKPWGKSGDESWERVFGNKKAAEDKPQEWMGEAVGLCKDCPIRVHLKACTHERGICGWAQDEYAAIEDRLLAAKEFAVNHCCYPKEHGTCPNDCPIKCFHYNWIAPAGEKGGV